jgi:ubiquinone/menaquinone biosynthesis C-methylase UbiE
MNTLKNDREGRVEWVFKRFKNTLLSSKSILDVGCDKAILKKKISGSKIKYLGVDIDGSPDLKLNLDEIKKLPFKKGEYETIVCMDVLEHLENIHLIFDEFCRVSKKSIIITLPNPILGTLNYYFGRRYSSKVNKDKKKFGKYQKFYGLPLEKPVDRHRWMYSYDEAVDFVKYRANKNTIELAPTKFLFINFIIKNNIFFPKDKLS